MKRWVIALVLVGGLLFVGTAPAAAAPTKPKSVHREVIVTDQNGTPLQTATVMACPYENGVADCVHLTAATTDASGEAELTLVKDVVYDLTAFVKDPQPQWACPGFLFNGGEFYFSQVVTVATNRFPADLTLAVHRPTANECVPVTVVDDLGSLLTSAGLSVCTLATDGTPCTTPTTATHYADGSLRLSVEPAITYRLTPFISNSGWACPQFVSPAGDTFHVGTTVDVTGAEVLAGITLVIHHPDASRCAELDVVDDLGSLLTSANVFVCPLAPNGTPCTEPTYPAHYADGSMHIEVDPAVTYRVTPFIADSGWPCPQFISSTGNSFHFGNPRDVTGAELIDGVTLVIHHPDASECA